jgi:16S rRNA (guanine527-N7)-methyltransferase
MQPEASPGLEGLRALLPVSRETYERLATLVGLVKKWQRAENLVAASTLDAIWTRHVADSAQLVAMFPRASHWLDLGSGGGFPGLVTAILLAGNRDGGVVHLVESNTRKCAFLRTAVRETGAPATIHQGRIEEVLAALKAPVDAISARALASLPDLFRLSGHLISPERPAAFLKGVDYRSEIEAASQSWDFDLVIHPSRISEGSVILEVTRAVPKAEGRT